MAAPSVLGAWLGEGYGWAGEVIEHPYSLLTPTSPRCIQINTDSSLLNSEFCFILKVGSWV